MRSRWLLVPALAACGGPPAAGIKFRSELGAPAPPLTTLRVFAPLRSPDPRNPVSAPLFAAFSASLVQRLASCHVTAEVVDGTAANGDAPAVLTIRLDDVTAVKVDVVDHEYLADAYYRGTAYFALALLAHDSDLWSARASFTFSHIRAPEAADIEDGKALARELVTTLRHDGLLTACDARSAPAK